MLGEFWSYYGQVTFSYYFYAEHLTRYRLWLKLIKALPVILTIVSSSGFFIDITKSFLWIAIMLAGQLLELYSSTVEIPKIVWSLEQYLADVSLMTVHMSKDWRFLNSQEEDGLEYALGYEMLANYEKGIMDIENRYLSSYSFSEPQELMTRADEKANTVLNIKHGGAV